jgi:hypothetical protein
MGSFKNAYAGYQLPAESITDRANQNQIAAL